MRNNVKYKSRSFSKGKIEWKYSNRNKLIQDVNPAIYKKGMCDAFAIALSRLINKPIYVVRGYYIEDEEEYYEDCHLVVQYNKNEYLDVEGKKSKKDLLSQCHFFMENIERVDLVQVSEKEAKFLMTMEGVSEEDIKLATEFIQKHMAEYISNK